MPNKLTMAEARKIALLALEEAEKRRAATRERERRIADAEEALDVPDGSPLVAVPFNVNEYVRVKLTERGKKCLRENYDKLAQAWGGKLTFQFRLPEEDADGWSRWQMWSLMQDLGPHISMGSEPPFETSIEVLANGTDQPRRGDAPQS